MADTIKQLGDALDKAEQVAQDYYESEFDFERGGRLQHDFANCPVCAFRKARRAYFAAIRAPVLASREKTPKLALEASKAEVRKAEKRVARLGETTSRQRLDAVVALEKAESDLEIIRHKMAETWVRVKRTRKHVRVDGRLIRVRKV
jgi:hypothetical protein